MNIYVGHSNDIDYHNELYKPIRNSKLNEQHYIVLPHESTSEPYDSKNFLKECDLMIAEVTSKSTGLGIELGWANIMGVPIVCVYKKGTRVSSSLNVIANYFIEYENSEDLQEKLDNLKVK